MTLAPGAFMRYDILRFGKIRRPWVHGWVQVVNVNQDPVRRYVVIVARVIVRCLTREIPGEWVDPRARTDAELVPV